MIWSYIFIFLREKSETKWLMNGDMKETKLIKNKSKCSEITTKKMQLVTKAKRFFSDNWMAFNGLSCESLRFFPPN